MEPFQIPWAVTAQRYPSSGARNRSDRVRLATAMPTPMPVKLVKNGCANGLNRHRTTNVAVSADVPPGPVPSVPL